MHIIKTVLNRYTIAESRVKKCTGIGHLNIDSHGRLVKVIPFSAEHIPLIIVVKEGVLYIQYTYIVGKYPVYFYEL